MVTPVGRQCKRKLSKFWAFFQRKHLVPAASFLFLLLAILLLALLLIKEIICNLPDFKHETVCLTANQSFCIASEYHHLLATGHPELVLIEPGLLVELQSFNWEHLRRRFDLPSSEGFGHQDHWLTVGVFASTSKDLLIEALPSLGAFRVVEKVLGRLPNSASENNNKSNNNNSSSSEQNPLHYFLQEDVSRKHSFGALYRLFGHRPLRLHIVVFHLVEEYLWVGAIPGEVQKKFSQQQQQQQHKFSFHFGAYEQIFDPFAAETLYLHRPQQQQQHFPRQHQLEQHISIIAVPDDIGHLLSQLPTSRYLHCPPERRDAWFRGANLTANKGKEEVSLNAYRQMKALARYLRMEVWIACGTLLGWYRQCTVTPYTTDTDFASWAKYVRAEAAKQEEEVNRNDKKPKKLRSLTELLKAEAAHHQLYLLNRFGEPWHSLEYSFATTGDRWEKADLFFVYPNRSHYLLPFHVPPQYAYSVYPRYGLCSGELLGFKVQVPCTPLEVITAEYGAEWQTPVSSWSYYEAPKNIGPLLPFAFANVSQHESFSE